MSLEKPRSAPAAGPERLAEETIDALDAKTHVAAMAWFERNHERSPDVAASAYLKMAQLAKHWREGCAAALSVPKDRLARAEARWNAKPQ